MARVPVLMAEPLVGSAPLQEPEAEQLLALVLVQLNCADWPARMLIGLTERLTDTGGGTGLELIRMMMLCVLVPPPPEQLSVYVKVPVVLMGPIVTPLVVSGWLPLQPSLPVPPLAVQEVVLDVFQTNVIVPPGSTNRGEALNVMAGGAGGALVAAVSI